VDAGASQKAEASCFVFMPPQLATRDGDIDLYLACCRRMVFESERGPMEGWVLALERMPQSRHVTRKPWHTHTVVASFRRAPDSRRGVCMFLCGLESV
jgi:hypothetical protein